MSHRVAWELTNGPVPDGLFVLHACDVRRCVRPDHLWLGTKKENTQDMLAKGRGNWRTGNTHPARRDPQGFAAHFRGRTT